MPGHVHSFATGFVFGEAKWLRSLRISGQASGSFGSLSLIHKSSSHGKNVPISVRQMGWLWFTYVYLVSSKSVMALTWQIVEACQSCLHDHWWPIQPNPNQPTSFQGLKIEHVKKFGTGTGRPQKPLAPHGSPLDDLAKGGSLGVRWQRTSSGRASWQSWRSIHGTQRQ